MNNQSQVNAQALRIRFDLSKVFPQQDLLSVPILRLMMATDDARHLQKSWIIAGEDLDGANDAEVAILKGEMAHLFRMLCSHLYEAGLAFRFIDQLQPDLLRAAMGNDEQGKEALNHVREAYAVEPQGETFHYSFLKPIRDEVGFHYKQEPLNQALNTLISTPNFDATLTVCENSGLSRYNITDHLTAIIITTQLNVRLEELPEKLDKKMEEVIKLAGHLASVVDSLVLHLFETRPASVLERLSSTITIPTQALRARLKVDKERTDQGAGEQRQP